MEQLFAWGIAFTLITLAWWAAIKIHKSISGDKDESISFMIGSEKFTKQPAMVYEMCKTHHPATKKLNKYEGELL